MQRIGDVPRDASHDLEQATRAMQRPLSGARLAWVAGMLIALACTVCGYEIGRMSGKSDGYEAGVKATEARIVKQIKSHGVVTVEGEKGTYRSVWAKVYP